MNTKVLITVTGMSDTGDPEGMPEFTQTKAEGTYAIINDKNIVSYEETDDETGQLLKTLIKFDENSAEVTRKGSIESKLVFVKDEKYETCYATPYGSFQMATITSRLEKEIIEEKINLHINYDMEINDSFVSKNSIVIEIETI